MSTSTQTPEETQLRTIYDDGFYFMGKDDALKIGGWAQVGYRAFLGESPSDNTFFIRRARLDIRGILNNDFAYRLYFSFERSSPLLQAWVDYNKYAFARIRLGQLRLPFSLEALYSARWIYFIERALGPTNLAPFEDIGIQLFGALGNSKIIYAIALSNGRGPNVLDTDAGKELAGRIIFQPFRGKSDKKFGRLYFGGSGSYAVVHSSVSHIRYRSAGRTTFLNFAPNTEENGPHTRYDIELEWLNGPFVLMGEYIGSKRNKVTNGLAQNNITTRSWYLAASYLLTGETQQRDRPVHPTRPFNPSKKGYGAWEIGARIEDFKTNAAPFENNLLIGRRYLSAKTAGLAWWPNFHLKFNTNFIYTDFHGDLIVSNRSIGSEKTLLFQGQFDF